jgi:hypothetical protein
VVTDVGHDGQTVDAWDAGDVILVLEAEIDKREAYIDDAEQRLHDLCKAGDRMVLYLKAIRSHLIEFGEIHIVDNPASGNMRDITEITGMLDDWEIYSIYSETGE